MAWLPTFIRHDGNMEFTHAPSDLAQILTADAVPQGSFSWNVSPWREQMHDLPDVLSVLDALPARVDRQTTREIVLTEFDAGRVIPAFVSAMIWGYGPTGFGPLRTRWILTGTGDRRARYAPVGPQIGERLQEGALSVRQDGPLEAFHLMNNAGGIKHLGAAYFTKWLYFVSALEGPDDPAAAPILDAKVTAWLREHAGIGLNVNRTSSYEEYLKDRKSVV